MNTHTGDEDQEEVRQVFRWGKDCENPTAALLDKLLAETPKARSIKLAKKAILEYWMYDVDGTIEFINAFERLVGECYKVDFRAHLIEIHASSPSGPTEGSAKLSLYIFAKILEEWPNGEDAEVCFTYVCGVASQGAKNIQDKIGDVFRERVKDWLPDHADDLDNFSAKMQKMHSWIANPSVPDKVSDVINSFRLRFSGTGEQEAGLGSALDVSSCSPEAHKFGVEVLKNIRDLDQATKDLKKKIMALETALWRGEVETEIISLREAIVRIVFSSKENRRSIIKEAQALRDATIATDIIVRIEARGPDDFTFTEVSVSRTGSDEY